MPDIDFKDLLKEKGLWITMHESFPSGTVLHGGIEGLSGALEIRIIWQEHHTTIASIRAERRKQVTPDDDPVIIKNTYCAESIVVAGKDISEFVLQILAKCKELLKAIDKYLKGKGLSHIQV